MVMARNQTLVQLTDELLAALDQAAASLGRSRSELIRAAIVSYLAEALETDADRAIVEGYRRVPQSPDPWVELSAQASIAQEPW